MGLGSLLIVPAVAVGAGAVVAAPIILSAAGFGAAGPTAGEGLKIGYSIFN